MKFSDKFYRESTTGSRWKDFQVKVETTDLLIKAGIDLSEKADMIVRKLRKELRDHIKIQQEFLTSLNPVERLPNRPEIINMMYEASETAGVGPMAAVAGAIAELTGMELREHSGEIIIENGGDIWMNISEPVVLNLFSGKFSFASETCIKMHPQDSPIGVCTSSARVGYSISLGKADAAVIICKSSCMADAIATETCNRVISEESITEAISFAVDLEPVKGAIIVFRDKMALQGDIELTEPIYGEAI